MSRSPYFRNTQCHPNIISWGGSARPRSYSRISRVRSTTPFPNKNGNTSTEFRLLWPRLAPRCADSLCISHCRVDTQLTVPPQPPPGILSHPFKREQIFQSSDHNKTPPRIPQYQLSRCEIVLALASPSPGSVTLRALHRCKAYVHSRRASASQHVIFLFTGMYALK